MLRSIAFGDEISPRINREVDCEGAVINASLLKDFPIAEILVYHTPPPSPSPSQEGEGEFQN